MSYYRPRRSIGWRRLRGLIARAQKEMGLDDDLRRELMHSAVGKRSCADMDAWEMNRVLDEFHRKGWRPTRRRGDRETRRQGEYHQLVKHWRERFPLPRPGFASPEQLAHVQVRWSYVSRAENAAKRILALRRWLNKNFNVAGLEMLSDGQAHRAIEMLKMWDARENGFIHQANK